MYLAITEPSNSEVLDIGTVAGKQDRLIQGIPQLQCLLVGSREGDM